METKTPDRSIIIAFILTVLFAGNNAIAVRLQQRSSYRLSSGQLSVLQRLLSSSSDWYSSYACHFRVGVACWGRCYLGCWHRIELCSALLGTGTTPGRSLHGHPGSRPTPDVHFRDYSEAGGFPLESTRGCACGSVRYRDYRLGAARCNVPLLPLLAVVGAGSLFAKSNIVIKTFPKPIPSAPMRLHSPQARCCYLCFSATVERDPTYPPYLPHG